LRDLSKALDVMFPMDDTSLGMSYGTENQENTQG